MIYAFYFSPTGGTKNILDIFLFDWNIEKRYIDLSIDDDLSNIKFENDDVCVVAVPSFSGRVPQFIIPKLSLLKAEKTKAVLLTAYGNRAFDDTLLELRDVMEKTGFLCFAAMAAVTRHSVMPKYGLGRPDSEDIAQIKIFSEKCLRLSNENVSFVNVSGNFPYRKYQSIPIKPKVNKNCSKCGLCAGNCPVKAIPPSRPYETDKSKCISCLQCVSKCPRKARYINRFILHIAEVTMKKLCKDRKENVFFLCDR